MNLELGGLMFFNLLLSLEYISTAIKCSSYIINNFPFGSDFT